MTTQVEREVNRLRTAVFGNGAGDKGLAVEIARLRVKVGAMVWMMALCATAASTYMIRLVMGLTTA